MSEKKEFTGVFIPAHIWESKELSPAEKMLLGEIDALSKRTGWCTAGRKHFADWLHCTVQNVTYYTNHLEEMGFIESVEKVGFGKSIRCVSSRFYVDRGVNSIDGGSKLSLPGVVNPIDGGGSTQFTQYTNRNKRLNTILKEETPNPLKGEKPIEQSEAFAVKEKENVEQPPHCAAPPAKKRTAQTQRELPTLPEKLSQCEDFVKAWSELTKTKKWRTKENTALLKSLEKLEVYPPEFAAYLCNEAIEKNYQGVVYDSAPAIFEKWKKTSGKAQTNEERYAPVDKIPTGDNSRYYDQPQKIVAPVAKPFERPGRVVLIHNQNK